MTRKLTEIIPVIILIALSANAPSTGENIMVKDPPKANIRFLYNYCNDLAEIRRFYTDLLGMEETAYNEDWNFLCYKTEGMDFMFFGSEEEISVPAKFAQQPGWEGGQLPVTSWTIDIPEGDFADTVKRLKNADVIALTEKPMWCVDSYWAFPVLDPMGNTVEVTMVPKEKPVSTTWETDLGGDGLTDYIADALEFYKEQSIITDPGEYRYLYDNIPSDIPGLRNTVQGLLLHIFHTHRYGIEFSEERKEDVEIRTAENMLARIMEIKETPLTENRSYEDRLLGNCRDFSVILCSMLRHKGIPARVRCGFATYFTEGSYEDHWICEYWSAEDNRWVKIDAQLDEIQTNALNIRFDTLDIPEGYFFTAGEIWELCRQGDVDPQTCGIMDMRGLWFVKDNVIRDLMALNKLEVIPWDCNEYMGTRGELSVEEGAFIDKTAALTTKESNPLAEIQAFYESEERTRMPDDWQP